MSTETGATNQARGELALKVPLSNRVAIYVPVKLGLVCRIISDLAHVTGGATSIQGKGAWINKAGLTQIEDVDIIYSYYDDEKRVATRIALFQCAHMLLNRGEEAVMIEYDGQAEVLS